MITHEKRTLSRIRLRKPSVLDSKKSTMLIIDGSKNIREVKMFAEPQRKQKKLNFHPIMVIKIDENKQPVKFYVLYEDIIYETESSIINLDTFFKVFWVYNFEYPKEEARSLKFLQELFFDMRTDGSAISTLVKDLVFELNRN